MFAVIQQHEDKPLQQRRKRKQPHAVYTSDRNMCKQVARSVAASVSHVHCAMCRFRFSHIDTKRDIFSLTCTTQVSPSGERARAAGSQKSKTLPLVSQLPLKEGQRWKRKIPQQQATQWLNPLYWETLHFRLGYRSIEGSFYFKIECINKKDLWFCIKLHDDDNISGNIIVYHCLLVTFISPLYKNLFLKCLSEVIYQHEWSALSFHLSDFPLLRMSIRKELGQEPTLDHS